MRISKRPIGQSEDAVRRGTRSRITMVVVMVFALLGLASPAGASTGCGEVHFSTTQLRLLNDGISNTAGPFALALEPGLYEITLESWDAHDEHYQPDQDQEQWLFSLDSGFVSPPSIDVPTEQNSITTHLGVHDLAAATTITFHHLGEGNVNSVQPTCVGFTPVTPAAAEVEEVVEEEVEEVVVEDAADSSIDVEVQGVVEVAEQTTLVPPQALIRGPQVDTAVASAQTAPVLALTGPGSATTTAVLGGTIFLVGLGFQLASTRVRLVAESTDTNA